MWLLLSLLFSCGAHLPRVGLIAEDDNRTVLLEPDGRMFRLGYENDAPISEKRSIGETRAEIVRLVEIFQEKGDSECRNGLWNVVGEPDEFCAFEKYRDWKGAQHEDCRDGVDVGGFENRGCVSRVDYTRYALASGLAQERSKGFSPSRARHGPPHRGLT